MEDSTDTVQERLVGKEATQEPEEHAKKSSGDESEEEGSFRREVS